MESNNNLENQRAIMKEHISKNNPLIADLLIPTAKDRGKVSEGISNNNANNRLFYDNSNGNNNSVNPVGVKNNQLTDAMASYFSQSPLLRNYSSNVAPERMSKPMDYSANTDIGTGTQSRVTNTDTVTNTNVTSIGNNNPNNTNNNAPAKPLPVYDNIEDIYMKELKNVMALPYTGEYANGIQSLFFLYITDRLSDSVMKSIPDNVKKEIRGIVMDFLSMLESY